MVRSRSRSRSEPGVFGSLEPEPLEKKQEPGPELLGKQIRSWSRSRLKKKSGARAGAGARAAKKFAGSPALHIYNICTILWGGFKKDFVERSIILSIYLSQFMDKKHI